MTKSIYIYVTSDHVLVVEGIAIASASKYNPKNIVPEFNHQLND
jgi:hypothetical protein